MYKKKDLLIILVLSAFLIISLLFLVFTRDYVSIGGERASIDNNSRTIFISIPEGSSKAQEVSFNFPFNNENIYIKPLSYGTKKIINPQEQKLTKGSSYDFKDFVFQGKIIIKTRTQKIEYDLLVTTGNLPIIKIDTADQNGNIQGVPDNKDDVERLDCKLNIFSSDISLNQSNVGIEIKTLGNTSNYEKISYSFNIKENTIKDFNPKILDFEDPKSFKLNPLNHDPSLMRIKLAYDIFNMLGNNNYLDIAPRSEYVEIFVDDDYKGVYLLEERVNKKLFNLPKYNKKDFKHSAIYEAEKTFANFTNGIQGFTQKEPDPQLDELYMDPLSELVDFIKNTPDETFNEQIGNIIDLNSAIDNQILFLLSCNQDDTALNQYIYKSNAINTSQKFLFCPGDYYISSFGIDSNSKWLESFKSFTVNVLFNRLYENPVYQQNFRARWNDLRKEMLTPENINKIIDKNFEELGDAQERNFKVIAFNSNLNDYKSPKISFDSEIKYMKEFINNRILWLDGQINKPVINALKIGSTEAKIYEDHNTIFCSLPLGSDPLQIIEYDVKLGSKVYIETKSYGIINDKPGYSEFYEYVWLMRNVGKTDQTLLLIDKPESDTVVAGIIQINGLALNLDVRDKFGIRSIFLFDGPVIGNGTFLGKANIRLPRQNITNFLKNPFYKNSGFEFEINTLNLTNGIHEFYIYVFTRTGQFSFYTLPLEVNNKGNISGKVEITSGQKFDFRDYIFHGSMIVEEDNTSKEYDLWITTGSLPVANISTDISDLNINEMIEGKIKIIDSSQYFEGNIGIKLRGWTSNQFEKKQYRIEIMDVNGNPKNISLLGLPKENDWILFGPYIDKSLIRNAVAFKLSNEIGLYAPRNVFMELFIGDIENTGNYSGVYSLTESIKADKNRVDIAKVSDIAANNPNINSTYSYDKGIKNEFILEITQPDKVRTDDVVIKTYNGTVLEIKYPNKYEISKEQKKWLTGYLNEFLKLLYSDDFNDPIKGYYRYVDMDSLVDYVIINELFKNFDTFNYSTLITIDIDGKIKFGPVWDFDFSTGKIYYTGFLAGNSMTEPEYDKAKEYNLATGWTYTKKQWATRFFMDDYFTNKLNVRWKELRKSVLSDQSIEDIIDVYVKELSDAQARNFNRWDFWSIVPFGEPDSYIEEIDRMRVWLKDRAEWLDKNVESRL